MTEKRKALIVHVILDAVTCKMQVMWKKKLGVTKALFFLLGKWRDKSIFGIVAVANIISLRTRFSKTESYSNRTMCIVAIDGDPTENAPVFLLLNSSLLILFILFFPVYNLHNQCRKINIFFLN